MWRDEGLTCLAMPFDKFSGVEQTWSDGDLHLMVGPSCAGKTRFISGRMFQDYWATSGSEILPSGTVISSDALRVEIAGSIGDMNVNDQVFAYITAVTKARVEGGLLTIIDATNIHARSRRPLLDVCSKDTKITYHVIDRPLWEKERDAGWRRAIYMPDGASLVRSHHESFKGALPTILAGDNDPRVTVIDHRSTE